LLSKAQILERRGDRARAIDHYNRFLVLWEKCDPELRPLLDEATRGLSRLGGSAGV